MTGIGRRQIILGVPAVASASMLTSGRTEAAPTDQRTSAVTYLPIAAQKQFVSNKADVEGKAYERFFMPDLEVPTAAARALQHGQLSKDQCLTPSVADLNKLLDPNYKTPTQGYAVLDGSTCYVQNSVLFPGATAEMFRWWFTWHPIERERYMLWFPQAHIENSVEDPARLANTKLSYAERLYDNPNKVRELVGPQPMDLLIRFTDPVKLGFDAKALRAAGFSASASGTVGPSQAPDVTNSLMIHLGRDVKGGMELVSRYWIGAHPELLRFNGADKGAGMMKKVGFNDQVAEITAYELAVHDMIEFNHLAKILPSIYAVFGKQ